MTTKKPDSKGILLSDSYIRNMKCSAIPVHFSINTDILLLQPCDPLCLFRGLTFMEKSPQTLMFTDFLATALTASLTPRVGLEPTTTRLTAECSTNGCARTPIRVGEIFFLNVVLTTCLCYHDFVTFASIFLIFGKFCVLCFPYQLAFCIYATRIHS